MAHATFHSSPPTPHASSPDPTTSSALTCPWCAAPAIPRAIAQKCDRCARKFTLSAGPVLDSSVVPPAPHPAAPVITLRWSIVVTYRFARLDPQGVSSGTLDPVVAVAPIDQAGIAYADIVSIAVWRRLGVVDCIIGVLVPLPIAFFAAYVAVVAVSKAPGVAAVFALIAVGFGLLTGYLLRRGIAIGRRKARIAGRYGCFTVPFETSPAFYEELFRRTGLTPAPIP